MLMWFLAYRSRFPLAVSAPFRHILLGPPGNEYKMRTLMRDAVRMRKLYGVPLVADNAQFPANAGPSNALLTYIKIHHPELLNEATRKLFEAYWRDQKAPADLDVVLEYVGPLFPGGKEALKAVYTSKEKMESEEVKAVLDRHTKEANETFAVGTPWMIVAKPSKSGGKPVVEPFFGSDRMDHIAQFLGLEWKGYIPPSATRYPGTEEDVDMGDAGAMFRRVKPLIDAMGKVRESRPVDGEKAKH